MIIPFSIDTDSFVDKDTHNIANFYRFLSMWHMHGKLILDSTSLPTSKIYSAIAKLPVDAQKAFQETLKRFPNRFLFCNNVEFLDSATDRAELEKLKNVIRVGLLSSEHYSLLASEEGGFAEEVPDLNLEITRYDSVDQSPAFLGVKRKGESPIPAGTPREVAIDEYFLPFITDKSSLILVDKYAACNLIKRTSGLKYFLNRLNASKVPSRISIYSSLKNTDETTVETQLKSYLKTLVPRKLPEIRIYLSPESVFDQHFHERFFQIDQSIITVGNGVDIFNTPRLIRFCSYNLSCTLNKSLCTSFNTALSRLSTDSSKVEFAV